MSTSFKAGVKTAGDRDWVFNGMRFATFDQAAQYVSDLAGRWTAVRDTTVLPSSDPVTEVAT